MVDHPYRAPGPRHQRLPVSLDHPNTWLRRIAYALREVLIASRRFYLTRVLGMNLHPRSRFSMKARFDRTNPSGIHLGAESYVAFGAVVLAHDMQRNLFTETRIGRRCFIGAHAILMPGITIGDHCVVAAGSVVYSDLPNGSLCIGNPARIVRRGLRNGLWGRQSLDGPAGVAEPTMPSSPQMRDLVRDAISSVAGVKVPDQDDEINLTDGFGINSLQLLDVWLDLEVKLSLAPDQADPPQYLSVASIAASLEFARDAGVAEH